METRPEYGTGRFPADDDGFADTRTLVEGLAAERRSPARPGVVACPTCGRPTERVNLMTASRGLACPECYDDASDW